MVYASPWQCMLLMLCRFNRLQQSFPGRWRLCGFLSRRSRHLATLPPRPAKVGRGTFLELDPGEPFDGLKTLINGLNPREPLVNLALQLLRPGDNAVDIGANVGYFSALASLAVGPRGQVFSFEAAPATHARLQTLARRNRFGNVTTFQVAVSDRAGEVELHCGPANHSGTTSLRDLGERTTSTVEVKALAIDDLLDILPPIRFVKIDVEGAEMLVLRGMAGLIARDRPYILTEVTDGFLRSLGSSKEQLVAACAAHGYTPLRVQRDVVPYQAQDEYQCDVLFVPEGAATVHFDDRLPDRVRW